jgi:hypothetical protein
LCALLTGCCVQPRPLLRQRGLRACLTALCRVSGVDVEDGRMGGYYAGESVSSRRGGAVDVVLDREQFTRSKSVLSASVNSIPTPQFIPDTFQVVSRYASVILSYLERSTFHHQPRLFFLFFSSSFMCCEAISRECHLSRLDPCPERNVFKCLVQAPSVSRHHSLATRGITRIHPPPFLKDA